MDFKTHLEKAWHLTLEHIAPLIIVTLVMFGIGVVTLGILAPVMMAGYMQAILLMVRNGRTPRVQDLFSEMRLFLPLLGFSIATVIAVSVGFALLFLPGLLLCLAISFTCLYMLPLMTDRRLGLVEAVKESYAMSVKGDIVDHIAVVILFMAITAIGGSVAIGWLLTQPFGTVFLMSVYNQRINSGLPSPPPASPPPAPPAA